MPRMVGNFDFFKFPSYFCLLYPRQFCSLILTGSDSHQVFRLVIKSTSYRLSNLSSAQNLSLVPLVTTVTITDALPKPTLHALSCTVRIILLWLQVYNNFQVRWWQQKSNVISNTEISETWLLYRVIWTQP